MNLQNIKTAIDRKIVELTANGFSDAATILGKFDNNGVYVANNVFQANVIMQCCERLGVGYTRLGDRFIISL